MYTIQIKVLDSKVIDVLEGLEKLNLVELIRPTQDEGDSKDEVVANLSQAFQELKQYKQGNLKTISAKDFLEEL